MTSEPHVLSYRFNVCAYAAPDLPGQWIGHCLELDLVTQGNSAQHAIEMLEEALVLVLTESEPQGVPPFRKPEAETMLAFANAPVWGTLDVGITFRWEADQSHPTLEVAAPRVALAG